MTKVNDKNPSIKNAQNMNKLHIAKTKFNCAKFNLFFWQNKILSDNYFLN